MAVYICSSIKINVTFPNTNTCTSQLSFNSAGYKGGGLQEYCSLAVNQTSHQHHCTNNFLFLEELRKYRVGSNNINTCNHPDCHFWRSIQVIRDTRRAPKTTCLPDVVAIPLVVEILQLIFNKVKVTIGQALPDGQKCL